MKASSFLGGAFIKVDDVKAGPLKATINTYEVSKFNNRGKEEQKLTLILDISGEEKKLTLNSTNLRELIAAFTDNADVWAGRTIALYFDPNVQYAGKPVGGVRVKTPQGARTAAEAAKKAAEAAAILDDPMPTAAEAAAVATPVAAPAAEIADDDIPF